MAEFFKIEKDGKEGLREAAVVYPTLRGRVNYGTKEATIYDAKKEEWVPVTKGDYIISIGDRFEVSDSEPEKAKPVEVPDETPAPEEEAPAPRKYTKKSEKSEDE